MDWALFWWVWGYVGIVLCGAGVLLSLVWGVVRISRPHSSPVRPRAADQTASDGAASPAPGAGEVAELPGRARRAAPLDLSQGHLSTLGELGLSLSWFDSFGHVQWEACCEPFIPDPGGSYVVIRWRDCDVESGTFGEWQSLGGLPVSVVLRAAWLVRDIR